MNRDFHFKLSESAHGREEDSDHIFTAKYGDEYYTVSFEGESVDYSHDDVDRWIQEGFWVLL